MLLFISFLKEIKKANIRHRNLKNLPNFATVNFSLLLKLLDKQQFIILKGEELKRLVRVI